MSMLSKKLAGLTIAVAFVALGPFTARAADGQESSGQQTEEQKKAREKKQDREKPAAAAEKKAPLRFTDLDLERFHGRPIAPAEDEIGAEEDAVGVPGSGPQPPPVAGTKAPAPPAGVAGPRVARPVTRPAVRPPGMAPSPQDDPLKPFRDREAKEKFRSEQIQKMRDRLADIDRRLEHLNARKLGVLDPLVGMPAPQSEDETRGEASLRPRELLEKIDGEIKGLEQEKEQVQAELVSVETRFSQESQSR